MSFLQDQMQYAQIKNPINAEIDAILIMSIGYYLTFVSIYSISAILRS